MKYQQETERGRPDGGILYIIMKLEEERRGRAQKEGDSLFSFNSTNPSTLRVILILYIYGYG